MKLQSSAFTADSPLPHSALRSGGSHSPHMAWTQVPRDVMSFVLLCDDPHGPQGPRNLWTLYTLPGDVQTLPEDLAENFAPLKGVSHGLNGYGYTRYDGPELLELPRRIYFRLYALDRRLALKAGVPGALLNRAREGHILAEAYLTAMVPAAP